MSRKGEGENYIGLEADSSLKRGEVDAGQDKKKEAEYLSGNGVSAEGQKYADLRVLQSETSHVRHHA